MTTLWVILLLEVSGAQWQHKCCQVEAAKRKRHMRYYCAFFARRTAQSISCIEYLIACEDCDGDYLLKRASDLSIRNKAERLDAYSVLTYRTVEFCKFLIPHQNHTESWLPPKPMNWLKIIHRVLIPPTFKSPNHMSSNKPCRNASPSREAPKQKTTTFDSKALHGLIVSGRLCICRILVRVKELLWN